MAEWIATEMAGLDLGDQRLNDRQCLLWERFSTHPQGSIPESLQGWAEVQAAYRFFDNEQVTAESVLAPHRQATLERIRQNGVVLVLQDTTELELECNGGFNKRADGDLYHVLQHPHHDHSPALNHLEYRRLLLGQSASTGDTY